MSLGYNPSIYQNRLMGAFTVVADFADIAIAYGVNPGPYSDLPGKTFTLSSGDGATGGAVPVSSSTYTFKTSDFADPHVATVTEVVAALTGWAATVALLSGGTYSVTGATGTAGAAKIALTHAAATTGISFGIGNGTANEELGFIAGLVIAPTGETTGTLITIANTDYPGIDWYAWQPKINYSILTPATWVSTYDVHALPGASGGSDVSSVVSCVVTPSSTTGATIQFTGTSGEIQTVLFSMDW